MSAIEGDVVVVRAFVGKKGTRVQDGIQMVTIYHVETGEAQTVKGINGREAVATGYWTFTAPGSPAAPVEGASGKTGKEARLDELKALSAEAVRAIATEAGGEVKNKAEAIEFLIAKEFPVAPAEGA